MVFERSSANGCLHSLFLGFKWACRKHNLLTQVSEAVASVHTGNTGRV